MIRRVTNPLHIVYIYIYTHSYILARHVHACTPTRVFITSFDNPSSAEQRSPPTGRKLGYQASEYLRVPAKFSAHIDPVPSFFLPSPHSVTHARVLHVFLPLFSSWHGKRPCVTLLLYARRAPVTLMSAPVVSLMRAIVKARLWRCKTEVARVRDTARCGGEKLDRGSSFRGEEEEEEEGNDVTRSSQSRDIELPSISLQISPSRSTNFRRRKGTVYLLLSFVFSILDDSRALSHLRAREDGTYINQFLWIVNGSSCISRLTYLDEFGSREESLESFNRLFPRSDPTMKILRLG